jgi:hypothetical protein
VLTSVIARVIHHGLVRDTKQDIRIWERKRYLARPALAEGDGPIGKYRIWAPQFYYEPPFDAVSAEADERATSLAYHDVRIKSDTIG